MVFFAGRFNSAALQKKHSGCLDNRSNWPETGVRIFAAVSADEPNTMRIWHDCLNPNNIDLKPPLLVGFFLSGLVTHGGVQG
jgi:hypothetical protein